MNGDAILRQLESLANADNVAGMARYGISVRNTLGVSMPALRQMARPLGKNHGLAQALWASEVHEARILAALIDDPAAVTRHQMDAWANDFDSWDVCDQCCGNLFDKTSWAYPQALRWSRARKPFVKRAGFVLMAALAVHDKKASDQAFLDFLPIIEQQASDERNFVKKAVNWALRQIGKRTRALNAAAIDSALRIQTLASPAARWIAADALRELRSAAVMARLREKAGTGVADRAKR
jgi:3-methyladenine DNA glycosylase AlkD